MASINTALALKQELDALRPISPADELRIMQKFRLDWNFHSNNLEGNSLTYGETKALILFGITAQGKPLKDHLEVTGHDEAIKWVEEVIKEERPLTENFIRQLHQLLSKEDYEVDAITPEGKPTKKWVWVGKYKTLPNHVRTKTGEIFRFASPEETPAKMHDLLEWYREKMRKQDVNPILLAAEFHYRFIRIHPFDDGNGRTARILMNFILMQFGYPPIIIKTQDKENYFTALRQADAGMIEPFIEYIASNLVRSLEIMIKGAKGGDIEEPDDLDKEISMLEKKLKSVGQKVDIKKSKKSILEFYDHSTVPLARKFVADNSKFDRFYIEKGFSLAVNGGDISNPSIDKLIQMARERVEQQDNIKSIYLEYKFSNFNREGLADFGMLLGIHIQFKLDCIRIINYSTMEELAIKTYGEQLTENEINALSRSVTKFHRDLIERKIAEIQKSRNNTNH